MGQGRAVASHDKMTFYNPLQHPDMVPADAQFIVFEGTYTKTFTNEPPTPYYEYNQLLYRLDLDDPALKPAQRVKAGFRAMDHQPKEPSRKKSRNSFGWDLLHGFASQTISCTGQRKLLPRG